MGFFGRGRDGVRNSPGELEGCLGIKIGNGRCSCGCIVLFGIVAVIAVAVVLILKFKYNFF